AGREPATRPGGGDHAAGGGRAGRQPGGGHHGQTPRDGPRADPPGAAPAGRAPGRRRPHPEGGVTQWPTTTLRLLRCADDPPPPTPTRWPSTRTPSSRPRGGGRAGGAGALAELRAVTRPGRAAPGWRRRRAGLAAVVVVGALVTGG